MPERGEITNKKKMRIYTNEFWIKFYGFLSKWNKNGQSIATITKEKM